MFLSKEPIKRIEDLADFRERSVIIIWLNGD